MATNPGVEDADGEVLDAASAEEAMWRMLDTYSISGEVADINHREVLKGKLLSGWYFPEENVFRFAFKPDDSSIVDDALDGAFDGSSFYATVAARTDAG